MKQNILKRTFVLFLAILMAFSSLPMAFAENAPEVADNSDYSVESTDSLGAMLAETVEATAADPNERYFISNMAIDGDKATVTFQNAAACDLVIAAYDEDTMAMLCSDTARVAAGADTAELTLTDLTAENMIIKAFLLDDNHQALCKNYTFREYSKDYKDFISKTVDDFNAEQVINLDEAEDNNFLVLNEGAKTVSPTEEANHIIIADFEEDTFVFSDADSAITGLKEGDLFYYALEDMEELIIIRVKSVTVDKDNTATVKGEQVALEDAFEYVKIDVDIEDEDFEALDETAAEISAEENQVAPRNATDIDREHQFTKSFSLNWPKKEDDDSSGKDKDDDGKVSFKLHGTGSFSATAKFRVYLSRKYKEVSFVVTTELKLDFGAEVEIKAVEKKLGEFGIHPIPGLFIGINPTFVFTISGKLSTNVTFGFDLGGQWDSKDGFTNKCRKLEPDFDGIDLEATVFVGIDLKPKARLISDKVVKAELSGTVGFELKGKMSWLKSGGRVEHLCKNCLDGSLAFKLDIVFKVVFAEGKHGWIVSEKKYEMPILNLTIPICDFYWSFTYGKHGGGKCPYHLVKVDFVVKDAADGKALENAEINSGTTDDISVKYNGDSAVVKTDKDGKASYYYPLGTYTATVTCMDYITKQTDEIKIDYLREADEFYVNDSAKQATIECKLTEDISHIQFGTYPQTRITDAATISKLDATDKTWASYGYYSGDGQSLNSTEGDFMLFADFFWSGHKYRAVRIVSYRPSDTYWPSGDPRYSIQDENGYTEGTTYYFSYDPIIWRVLDPVSGYVMCESIIDAQPFNNTVFLHDLEYWQDIDHNYYLNNYANSSIERWLVYDFYETAFSDGQKDNIMTTTQDNKTAKTQDSKYDSDETADKVFLLSYWDCYDRGYFSHEDERIAEVTEYAICQGSGVISGKLNNRDIKRSLWWLRTPGSKSEIASIVNEYGFPSYANPNGQTPNTRGVRPACVLANLKSDTAISSELFSETKGSRKKSPYIRSKVADPQAFAHNETLSVKTASCSDVVNGEEYVLLVVKDEKAENLLMAGNLLYIDQQTASGETVTFSYVPRETVSGAVAKIYGPDKDSHVHKFGEWTVTTPATVEAEGEETRTCSVCGVVEKRSIPKIKSDGPQPTTTKGLKVKKESVEGNTLRVALYAEGCEGLSSASLYLSYDRSVLRAIPFDRYDVGEKSDDVIQNNETTDNSITISDSIADNGKIDFGIYFKEHLTTSEPFVLRIYTFEILDKNAASTDITVENKSFNGVTLTKYDTFAIPLNGKGEQKPETPEYKKGDVDGDGEVTSGDARLALRASVQLEKYEAGSAQFLAADVDGNGEIEASDARTILRVSVKLETFA